MAPGDVRDPALDGLSGRSHDRHLAAGGTYDGSPFAATATIAGVLAGVDNTPASSLEGVGLTLDYQLLDANGNVVEDLGASPTEGGTYLVTASFAGGADYAPTIGSTVFVIDRATATINVDGYSGLTTATPMVPPARPWAWAAWT